MWWVRPQKRPKKKKKNHAKNYFVFLCKSSQLQGVSAAQMISGTLESEPRHCAGFTFLSQRIQSPREPPIPSSHGDSQVSHFENSPKESGLLFCSLTFNQRSVSLYLFIYCFIKPLNIDSQSIWRDMFLKVYYRPYNFLVGLVPKCQMILVIIKGILFYFLFTIAGVQNRAECLWVFLDILLSCLITSNIFSAGCLCFPAK